MADMEFEVQENGAAGKYRKGMLFEHADEGRNRLFSSLSNKAWEKLHVHALKFGCGPSELLDTIICKELNVFVVSDRSNAQSRRSANRAGQVNLSVEDGTIAETLPPSPEENTEPQSPAGEGSGGETENAPQPRRRRAAVSA